MAKWETVRITLDLTSGEARLLLRFLERADEWRRSEEARLNSKR
jgi:hypothetical protein